MLTSWLKVTGALDSLHTPSVLKISDTSLDRNSEGPQVGVGTNT